MSFIDDGMAALHLGGFDEAAELFRRAIDAADNEADRALATMGLAAIDVLKHRRDPDLRVFRENIMRRHSPQHVAVAAYYLTIAAVDADDREAATRYLPVLLGAVRETGDPVWTAIGYDVAAGAESIRGNHIAAIEYGRVALAATEECPERDRLFLLVTVAHNLAYNCLAANEHEDAVLYAESAVAVAEATHYPEIGQLLITAAFAYLCRERLDDAIAHIERAEPMVAGTYLEKYGHYLRGEIARRRGDLAEAARHFKRLEVLYPGIPTLTDMLLSMNLAPVPTSGVVECGGGM
ncbi:MAG TPA: hypothetical protein VEU30_11935 [Thermoanaerobaculia bacterium]|nr:hypothetical protein [Thermoanaerobaculia bacterium]